MGGSQVVEHVNGREERSAVPREARNQPLELGIFTQVFGRFFSGFGGANVGRFRGGGQVVFSAVMGMILRRRLLSGLLRLGFVRGGTQTVLAPLPTPALHSPSFRSRLAVSRSRRALLFRAPSTVSCFAPNTVFPNKFDNIARTTSITAEPTTTFRSSGLLP